MTGSGTGRRPGRPRVERAPDRDVRHRIDGFMRAEEFVRIGRLLFPGEIWEKRVADALGINPASVYRYSNEQIPIPGPVALCMNGWDRARLAGEPPPGKLEPSA